MDLSAPDKSVVVFAGKADANSKEDLENLLAQLLDEDNEYTVVLPQTVSTKIGLRIVHDWLHAQYEEVQREPDLRKFISNPPPDVQNIVVAVMWGDGDDEKTAELIRAASAQGYLVVDLTDGLEEIKLDQEPDPASRPVRRTRAKPLARKALKSAEPGTGEELPWEPEKTAAPDSGDLTRQVMQVIAVHCDAIAAEIRELLVASAPGADRSPAQGRSLLQSVITPGPENSQEDEEKAAGLFSHKTELEPGAFPWLYNPVLAEDNPEAWVPGPLRGNTPAARKGWKKYYLTEKEEYSLKLTAHPKRE